MEETLNFYEQKKLRQPFLDLYSYELPGLGPFFGVILLYMLMPWPDKCLLPNRPPLCVGGWFGGRVGWYVASTHFFFNR